MESVFPVPMNWSPWMTARSPRSRTSRPGPSCGMSACRTGSAGSRRTSAFSTATCGSAARPGRRSRGSIRTARSTCRPGCPSEGSPWTTSSSTRPRGWCTPSRRTGLRTCSTRSIDALAYLPPRAGGGTARVRRRGRPPTKASTPRAPSEGCCADAPSRRRRDGGSRIDLVLGPAVCAQPHAGLAKSRGPPVAPASRTPPGVSPDPVNVWDAAITKWQDAGRNRSPRWRDGVPAGGPRNGMWRGRVTTCRPLLGLVGGYLARKVTWRGTRAARR